MLTGPLGLNTVPSARMDETGTVRLGVSTLDPYAHSYIGFQLAEPLYVNIRQSAEVSNLNENADHLYPGLDFKLRLLEENAYCPAIVIGAQSAIGHKRMAGEYIALSKRYKDFDFTAGLGWGRYGSAAQLDNPLKVLSSHFGEDRLSDSPLPNGPTNWFTGDKIGLFGGAEYFTPWEGLSLKLDLGADRYEAENAAFDFATPAPWSIGASYRATDWLNFSIAAQGTGKLMGRLTLTNNLKNWFDRDKAEAEKNTVPFRAFRTDLRLPDQMQLSAEREDVLLNDVKADNLNASADILLRDTTSSPQQIGQAVKHMANHAGPDVEAINLTPRVMGLRGPQITMLRSDFEKAAAHHRGSPEEIWHNAEFDSNQSESVQRYRRRDSNLFGLHDNKLIFENQASLAEEDSGVLYRSALLLKTKGPRIFGLFDHGYALRINAKDNLERLGKIRPRAILPVRSNVDVFAERTFALDEAYLAFTHSFRPDFHLSLISGYLEEMYAGTGGELLYRPFGKRYAFGIEGWQSFKRDPYQDLNIGFNGDHVFTGHVNGWYDIPGQDLTLNIKAGRFLAEDLGARISAVKRFDNGAKLEGFVTLSNQADFDLFGGTTHSYNGIRLSLPLGGIKYVPRGVAFNAKFEPFGRDIGQDIQKPISLYEATEPLSFPHLKRHWNKIVPK